MNEISLAKAKEEIGTDAYVFLERLIAHYGGDAFGFARLAQSIITRSEVELFGLSIPRFAVRLYLNNGGFVNCRRIATLIKMYKIDNLREWGSRYSDDQILPDERNPDLEVNQLESQSIGDVMNGQSCIADSLLMEPSRLASYHFRYLDPTLAKLPEAYSEGERFSYEITRKAIPYTHTINLGGGHCAQAVSFITTAILANYSKAVHGIAEITALAHHWKCRELGLGSLEPEGMAHYLNAVNLRLLEQCLTQKPSAEVTPVRAGHFGSIVRCYLDSGMPVLFPTSLGKLAEHPSLTTSIYYDNGLKILREDLPTDEDHIVVIVGSSVSNGERFVLHDTATLPFLVATLDQLSSVGVNRKLSTITADNGVIMPVVPKPVKMPLLDERTYSPHPTNPTRRLIEGLRYGLDVLSRTYHFLSDYPCQAQPNHSFDRFRLIRSDSPHVDLRQCADDYRLLLECGLLKAISIMDEKLLWEKPHWLWLEIFTNSVWLWNAESKPLLTLPDSREEIILTAGSGHLLATVHVAKNTQSCEIEMFIPVN